MWESTILTSQRGNSVRRILTIALAAFIAAFLWILLSTTHANAASNATWQDSSSITYNGRTFNGPGIADGTTDPALQSGDQYFQSTDQAGLSGNGKAYVIYFGSTTDLTMANSASYVTYDINGSTGAYQNESAVQTITVTPSKKAGTASSTSPPTSTASSCTIDGVGWIVCPITNFLAKSMDGIYDLLKGFLVVQPLATKTTNNPLYTTWNVIRSVANVAFVIAFLVIIYAQLTNTGLSNYSLKKLIPRLIIAAVLVNVSYFICAFAVDLSNILGDSLQQVLVALRTHSGIKNPNSLASWQSVSGFILAGGTATTAAIVGISGTVAAVGGSLGAAIILLLPMLVALLLAVLVALIVLAARQALIIILIIVAPLAFVAYLLPNTEKWFKRWRETFTTLLVFYPMFSLIFGGSQLAAFLIIQNATQINTVLLAMFVQVAPLVLTPLLIRFSGDIVGRVAGMVNNPKKGLLDRTRAWSKDRSEYLAAKSMASDTPLRRNQVFRRYARGYDQSKRRREGYKKAYDSMSDARWTNSQDFQNIDQLTRTASDRSSLGTARSETVYNNNRTVDPTARALDYDLRNAQQLASNAKGRSDLQYKEYTAGLQDGITGQDLASKALARRVHEAREAATESHAVASRTRIAENLEHTNYAQELLRDSNLRVRAGGTLDPGGADSALASAITTMRSDYNKSIEEGRSIIKHFNLSSEEVKEHALGVKIENGVRVAATHLVKERDGATYDFSATSRFTREAALEDKIKTGTIGEVEAIIQMTGYNGEGENAQLGGLGEFKTSIKAAMEASGVAAKAEHLGGQSFDDIGQGRVLGSDGLDALMTRTIAKGKMSSRKLALQDPDTLSRMLKLVTQERPPEFDLTSAGDQANYEANRLMIESLAKDLLNSDDSVNITSKARAAILAMAKHSDSSFEPVQLPRPTDDKKPSGLSPVDDIAPDEPTAPEPGADTEN